METKIESCLPRKTIKKVIKIIEKNSELHVVDIDLFNEILRKYEEENKHNPPKYELVKQSQEIFLDLITIMKKLNESQIKFNKNLLKILSQEQKN